MNQIHFTTAESSLGSVLLAATDRGACAISLGDDPGKLVHDLEARYPSARFVQGEGTVGALVAKVVALVEDPKRPSELPLDIQGTAFQQRVWEALRRIPVGRTVSYAELATAIGAPPSSARAVARACATNALAVAIPCHRVVRGDGDLSGYRWGIERKRALLERESRS